MSRTQENKSSRLINFFWMFFEISVAELSLFDLQIDVIQREADDWNDWKTSRRNSQICLSTLGSIDLCNDSALFRSFI